MEITLCFYLRCTKFIKMACESKTVGVATTIASMCMYGSYSIIGGNKRHLNDTLGMEITNIIYKT